MSRESVIKRKWMTVACAVLVIAVIVYLFHDVFSANYTGYVTQTADETVEQDTVNLSAFVVRDEKYISGKKSGTIVPVVSDGNRVAAGDPVALICGSAEEAASYAALNEARSERERFDALSNQTDVNGLNMEKLNSELEKCYAKLLETTGTLDYGTLSSDISALEDRLAEKQILSEGEVDFTDRINAIDKKIAELEKKNADPQSVEAPSSGYYISNTDGFENTVDYNNIADITVSQVDSILKSEPEKTDSDFGKIVSNYRWYLVSTVDSKYTKLISVGKTLRINIPYYGIEKVSVRVENISAENNGRVALVLSCNLMDENYANMRKIDAELILHEYTGYKVPASAVRSTKTDDGKSINVVYILRGDYMTASVIDIIYTPKDADYVVVATDTKSIPKSKDGERGFTAIKRYDEVIVKGRNLENGKSVG